MIYVDDWNANYGNMIMNHMFADTIDELNKMADKIGVDKKWFQNRLGFPHYDVCQTKKQLAIKNGAEEVTWRKVPELVKKNREAAMSEDEEELSRVGDSCPNCSSILCLDEIQEMKCFSCGCDLTNPEEWEDEHDDDVSPYDDEYSSDEEESDL